VFLYVTAGALVAGILLAAVVLWLWLRGRKTAAGVEQQVLED
jgi:hypothetical protein